MKRPKFFVDKHVRKAGMGIDRIMEIAAKDPGQAQGIVEEIPTSYLKPGLRSVVCWIGSDNKYQRV